MQPKAENGSNRIDNAIPVCFECHAEIHSYNDDHPRGKKFSPQELRKHKEQWLAICRERPEALLNASREIDVGPLQALIDELEFNLAVARAEADGDTGCLFQQAQFLRGIHQGSIAILKDEVKETLVAAYRMMGSANTALALAFQQGDANKMHAARTDARRRITASKPQIERAKDMLLSFLRTEPG